MPERGRNRPPRPISTRDTVLFWSSLSHSLSSALYLSSFEIFFSQLSCLNFEFVIHVGPCRGSRLSREFCGKEKKRNQTFILRENDDDDEVVWKDDDDERKGWRRKVWTSERRRRWFAWIHSYSILIKVMFLFVDLNYKLMLFMGMGMGMGMRITIIIWYWIQIL